MTDDTRPTDDTRRQDDWTGEDWAGETGKDTTDAATAATTDQWNKTEYVGDQGDGATLRPPTVASVLGSGSDPPEGESASW